MKKIKAARLQAGITQKQLADRYQIPLRTLQDYESDLRNTPPVYVENLLLRCMEIDYGIKIEDLTDSNKAATTATTKRHILTYMDDRPLSLQDEMYVLKEKDEKRITMIRSLGDALVYKCSNGFEFKSKLNKNFKE